MEQHTGWFPSNEVWIYASANSFTINGIDRTAIYTPGTRVKCENNSSIFYGVVVSSSFSTNTTVVLAANDDFSLNNSVISYPSYSYAENPAGYPDWFAYTPTYTGISSSASFASFKLDGKSCTVIWQQCGGQSNSTDLTITLPITPLVIVNTAQGYDNYLCQVYDQSTFQTLPGIVGIAPSTQAAKIGKTIATQASNAYGGFTNSAHKGVLAEFTYPIS